MKKIVIAFGILLCVSTSEATFVRLPHAKVLRQRLSENGFDHFMEKTEIIASLTDRELDVLGVIIVVNQSLYAYYQYLKNPMTIMTIEMRKTDLLELILQDSPDALEDLEKKLKLIAASESALPRE